MVGGPPVNATDADSKNKPNAGLEISFSNLQKPLNRKKNRIDTNRM